MENVQFGGMDTSDAEHFQAGGADSYGHKPQRAISDGSAIPCRHCLQAVEKGDEYLILAYRPFSAPQPYAETGPIFVHAKACLAYRDSGQLLPPVFELSPNYIVRGYGSDERIVYGTGAVTANSEIRNYADTLLQNPEIEFVHVRSASNNCWQAKITRQS